MSLYLHVGVCVGKHVRVRKYPCVCVNHKWITCVHLESLVVSFFACMNNFMCTYVRVSATVYIWVCKSVRVFPNAFVRVCGEARKRLVRVEVCVYTCRARLSVRCGPPPPPKGKSFKY